MEEVEDEEGEMRSPGCVVLGAQDQKVRLIAIHSSIILIVEFSFFDLTGIRFRILSLLVWLSCPPRYVVRILDWM